MIMVLNMPRVVEEMQEGEIYHWVLGEGDYVNYGDTFLDVYVELDPDFKGNCPPVFHIEITANDAGYLRKILVPDGEKAKSETAVAVFTTEANEALPSIDKTIKTGTSFRFMTQTI